MQFTDFAKHVFGTLVFRQQMYAVAAVTVGGNIWQNTAIGRNTCQGIFRGLEIKIFENQAGRRGIVAGKEDMQIIANAIGSKLPGRQPTIGVGQLVLHLAFRCQMQGSLRRK